MPIFGYKLYSDLGTDHDFQLVYDGSNKPSVTQYTLTNVTDPLVTYRFYATGINFNGEGVASGIARLRSCTTPSSGAEEFAAPLIDATTSTRVTISWAAPKDDGGCEILGYAIYVDNSAGVFSEYDASNVRNKPLLSSYVIDMQALGKTASQTYLIKVGAVNTIGEVQSDTVSVLLASIPATPSPPTKTFLNDTHAQIVMSPPASDGGDTIKNYELQVKIGYSEDAWSTVLGATDAHNLDLIYTLPITLAGQLIQARYRCMNDIGWSSYSIPQFITLAHEPSRPPKPVYVSSDDVSISIQIPRS